MCDNMEPKPKKLQIKSAPIILIILRTCGYEFRSNHFIGGNVIFLFKMFAHCGKIIEEYETLENGNIKAFGWEWDIDWVMEVEG